VILDFYFGISQEHCMNKLVFASAMALASMSLVSTPALRAQDSGQISLPPDQFNSYQNAMTQTDPGQKAAALEGFLQAYPQSPVKTTVLDNLIDVYYQLNQPAKAIDAANRLLQVDPNNMKAIFASVSLKKQQCSSALDASGVATDPQTCDDAAVLAQKGLTVAKPAAMSADDWGKLTSAAYPAFHSAIAFDDAVSKKDFAGAIKEYNAELMLYSPATCTQPGPCLADTLQLAQAYAKPGPDKDEVKAVWFYARAWDFAPAAYKAQIEPQLDYWYKRFHGTLDGDAAITQQIDAIKAQAQATLFPPASFAIAPAPTPADLAHHAYTSGDPKALSLEDKEYILANGSDADATGLWALLKGQPTPVPGIVIADPASELHITVTATASVKPKEFVVKLTNPVACTAVPPPPSELKVADAQAYILANGVKADTDAMGDALTDTPAHIRKIAIDPSVGTLNVAVTQDAKDAHTADFTVNLKDPLSCKEAPASGSALGLQPATELDGTYDTYTHTAAAGTTAASAQIVLTDGFLQPEKKAGAVHHTAPKPSPAHHAQ
jgi:tetratricopeptide (TPR) repeat protein